MIIERRNMNRQQLRQMAKKYNLNINQSKVLASLIETARIKKTLDDWKPIPEGTKVKLNIKQIKSHPDYERLTDKYKSWVEEHRNYIFTVEYDPKHTVNPTLLCLAEDESSPKWLFWEGDLTVVNKT